MHWIKVEGQWVNMERAVRVFPSSDNFAVDFDSATIQIDDPASIAVLMEFLDQHTNEGKGT